jgi:hypothetical protein
MRKGRISILILLVAFLLSAWGNVIGASFCPRYLAQNCFARNTQQAKQVDRESCNHEMSDTDMGDMQMDGDSVSEPEVTDVGENPTIEVATGVSLERIALDLPNEPCGHCWMHSQPSSGTGIMATVNPSPRSVEALAPPADITTALGFPNPIATEPLEHGPPGSSSPRYILINVFRI